MSTITQDSTTATLDSFALRGIASQVALDWSRHSRARDSPLPRELKQQLASDRMSQLVSMELISEDDHAALMEFASTGTRPGSLDRAAPTSVASIIATSIEQWSRVTTESFFGDLLDAVVSIAEGAALGFIIAGVPGAILGGLIVAEQYLPA